MEQYQVEKGVKLPEAAMTEDERDWVLAVLSLSERRELRCRIHKFSLFREIDVSHEQGLVWKKWIEPGDPRVRLYVCFLELRWYRPVVCKLRCDS
jgi:hypothetical protein